MNRPRLWSPRKTRWLLDHYPPWFFHRIRVLELADDFRYCRVRARRSILTRNLHGSTFGGTLFSAADPIYPVLYWQIFARRGDRLQAWLKAASIDYRKPAETDVELEFRIGDADVAAAAADLAARGKCVRTHRVEAVDRAREVCAVVDVVVFLRPTPPEMREVSAF